MEVISLKARPARLPARTPSCSDPSATPMPRAAFAPLLLAAVTTKSTAAMVSVVSAMATRLVERATAHRSAHGRRARAMATSGAMSRKSPSKLGRAANSTMPTTRAMPQIEPMTVAMSMPQSMKGASAFACSAPEHPMTKYERKSSAAMRARVKSAGRRRPSVATLAFSTGGISR